ncbi:murein transglycosylase domain-containing protein [Algibacillus agarilyticus]|uniref:transglycosylase SLT domain-containing protein n=1 Tax=Algibacillus agarilyticus TaxID=2234133 RepID=UPI000DCFB4CF|nr:murein transglycosylase domain-containing protein [Algibacillus agarilyticus]
MARLPALLATSLILSSFSLSAQESDPFAELDAAMESLEKEGTAAEMSEFQQWKDEYLAEYQAFRQEHFQRVDDIRDNLMSIWGDAEVSTTSQFVEYSDDQKTKTVYDFENDEIRISVVHGENEEVDAKAISKILTDKLTIKKQAEIVKDVTDERVPTVKEMPKSVFEQADKMTQSEHEQKHSATQKPTLVNKDTMLASMLGDQALKDNLIKDLVTQAQKKEQEIELTKKPSAVIEKEIKLIKKQAVAQIAQVEKMSDLVNAAPESTPNKPVISDAKIAKEQKQIQKETEQRIKKLKQTAQALTTDKNKRDALANKKITTFTVPLANKNQLTKAKPFIEPVLSEAKRWDLTPSLMLAIMHTESHFNPKAESHIPAYGLMQVVPRSAGVDVNRFLFKQDKPMLAATLFEPDKNIEAGVAYMHILNSRYLRKIENPLSRMYCMIAAYNTGSGNVAKTFNKDGSRNINRAAKIINQLSPEDVYAKLLSNLPYDETRNYVKKVTKRQNLYTSLDKI